MNHFVLVFISKEKRSFTCMVQTECYVCWSSQKTDELSRMHLSLLSASHCKYTEMNNRGKILFEKKSTEKNAPVVVFLVVL